MKKRIVVVAPGRGSYTKETLGYLNPHRGMIDDFIKDIDNRRKAIGAITVTELDQAEKFSPAIHTKGENASPLIYACSYADFVSIDRNQYEIVAITGNSMGWYLALAFAGALNWVGAFDVINTMGSMMKDSITGGQIIYPIVDKDWIISQERIQLVEAALKSASQNGGKAYHSIHLGGYAVIGADKDGLKTVMASLPKDDIYPFQLVNHAAFHTPLLAETSQRAFQELPENLFHKPQTPLIDGQGKIWMPYSTDVRDLYQYTLGTQVVETYSFTKAITVALKEFAPDQVFLLGPGNSLGGSIGQILIESSWEGIRSKADFSARQKESPFLVSMGLAQV